MRVSEDGFKATGLDCGKSSVDIAEAKSAASFWVLMEARRVVQEGECVHRFVFAKGSDNVIYCSVCRSRLQTVLFGFCVACGLTMPSDGRCVWKRGVPA